MIPKYERPDIQKTIIATIDRYVYRLTDNHEAIINITKSEFAQTLEISLVTLNKYLEVYTKIKGFTCKFLDEKQLITKGKIMTEKLQIKTEDTNESIVNEIITHKISFKNDVFRDLSTMASFYHYDKKLKLDAQLSRMVEDAVNYIYKNKFLKDLKED